jgi:hypothetical protein
MYLFGSLSEISTIAGGLDAIWQVVLAIGIAMVGWRVGKRLLRF